MAAHLFLHLGNLQPRLLGEPPPTLLLDFDGTLAPIVPEPAEARMAGETSSLLEELAGHRGATIGVVSGRSLAQLRTLVPLRGLILVGNHGLEISGPGWSFLHPEAATFVPGIRRACGALQAVCARFPGARIEDKDLSASLHFRKVPVEALPDLQRAVEGALRGLPGSPPLRISQGRRVWEIRPPVEWDKGRACQWVLKRTRARPERTVYMGDDRTDEDAFRRLPKSVTIKVGTGDTLARYFVRDETEAAAFLSWLAGRNGT